jgi:fatty-acyl-CoA synthase
VETTTLAQREGATAHGLVSGCPSTMGDDFPLNTTTLIRHAARTYGDQEIVYRSAAGGWERYTYRECYDRVCHAAGALRALGVGPGDRVGVVDWNSRRYELAYIVNHSNATHLCVDETLLPLAEAISPHVPGVKAWIVMTDQRLDQIKTSLRPLHHHEDAMARAAPVVPLV